MLSLETLDPNQQHFIISGNEPYRTEISVVNGRVICHVYRGTKVDMDQSPTLIYDGTEIHANHIGIVSVRGKPTRLMKDNELSSTNREYMVRFFEERISHTGDNTTLGNALSFLQKMDKETWERYYEQNYPFKIVMVECLVDAIGLHGKNTWLKSFIPEAA